MLKRKPSDSREATRARKAKSRAAELQKELIILRGKRFDGWIDSINRTSDILSQHPDGFEIKDQFRARAQETGLKPEEFEEAILARITDLETERDYWLLATGQCDLPAAWDAPDRLALQAMLADAIQLIDDEEVLKLLDKRYQNNWRTSDSDIGTSARGQLSRELVPAVDDDTPTSPFQGASPWYAGPSLMPIQPKVRNPGDFARGVRLSPDLDQGWDPQSACEMLRREANRFCLRRKIKLKSGRIKEFEVARATPVRRPALEVFKAKRVFPVGKEWFRRLGWSQERWKTKPAKVRRIYRPPADSLGIECRYRQDYPKWAAEPETGQLINGWTYATYQWREHKNKDGSIVVKPPLRSKPPHKGSPYRVDPERDGVCLPGLLEQHLGLAAVMGTAKLAGSAKGRDTL